MRNPYFLSHDVHARQSKPRGWAPLGVETQHEALRSLSFSCAKRISLCCPSILTCTIPQTWTLDVMETIWGRCRWCVFLAFKLYGLQSLGQKDPIVNVADTVVGHLGPAAFFGNSTQNDTCTIEWILDVWVHLQGVMSGPDVNRDILV